MRVEARLIGGPGQGKTYVLDGLKPQIVIQRLAEPISFNVADNEDPFATVPVDRYTYEPVGAVVYYEMARVEHR